MSIIDQIIATCSAFSLSSNSFPAAELYSTQGLMRPDEIAKTPEEVVEQIKKALDYGNTEEAHSEISND